MKQLLGVLVVGALAAIVFSQTTINPDVGCRTCNRILDYADFLIWRSGQNWTEQNLEGELEHECVRLGGIEGTQVGQHCLHLVRTHIDTIYNDILAKKFPEQICQDIGECRKFTFAPKFRKAAKAFKKAQRPYPRKIRQ